MNNDPGPQSPTRGSFVGVLVALPLCIGLASIPTPAEEVREKLQIFGYLTQAYGKSSRGSIVGTEEDGTTDLGNVALQFRWNRSTDDAVVVQLAHERRGDDLFLPKSEEVDIDWAFYEKRFRNETVLRVGRLNIPLGIYNEVRDVGTLLPFFSLPISVYSGVLSSAETVDGVSISRTFQLKSSWTLDAEAYFGGWDTFQQQLTPGSRFGIANLSARAEEGLGVQFWLEAPYRAMRFGAGSLTWLLDGPVSTPGKDRWNSYHLSVDMTFEKWLLRAETRHWRFDQDFGAFLGLPNAMPAKAERDGFYLQAGTWLTPSVGLFAQLETAALKDNMGILPGLGDFHDDAAVSLNYRFNPDLQARIELHAAETLFPLGLPGSIGIATNPVDVNWVIVAVSASF